MFKKKKKNQKELKETELSFKKEEKKKPEIPVRIGEYDDYAVSEPFDLSKQKKAPIQQKTKIPKGVKQKLIIQKIQSKEIKPEKSVQKVLPKSPEKITKLEESISKIPINHIETDIDKLMKIIDEKKIVGLDYLSKILKISVERLEAWAKLLEDRGLIEIEYPIIGLPKLRKKECKKES